VELGSDDPALELPWSSSDPHVRYYDLKNHPELVKQIPEVVAHPELGSFLSRINAAGFPLATAKCDVWSSEEVAPEEEIFGDRKFVSYIDVVFINETDRCSFESMKRSLKTFASCSATRLRSLPLWTWSFAAVITIRKSWSVRMRSGKVVRRYRRA